jgi:hypothetical protein
MCLFVIIFVLYVLNYFSMAKRNKNGNINYEKG